MSFLYMCTIYPLELIYKYIYLACVSIAGSYGVGLIVMSLVTFTVFVPLKEWAKKSADKERDIQDVLAPQIAKIQSESTGAERQERISKLYHRYGYHPVMAVRSAVGAGLQIPFLMAAYYMISNLKGLEGQSFLFVKDLSKPDALLFGLNLLPILMTLINFATTFTTKDMRKKDRIQAVVIALLFLALLYTAPSALLIYWTCNNILYLLENFKSVKAGMDKIFSFMRRAINKLKGIQLAPKQKSLASALCFGLLCGVFLFIFIPLNTYWHNVNEFDFKPDQLARFLVPYALICSLITGCMAFFASKNKKASANGVSSFHVFILSVMIAFLVEGTLMGYGLHLLNGEENLFASKGRMIFDTLVWLCIIGGFTYFRHRIARNFVKVTAVFVVFCFATLIDTYHHREEKATASDLKIASDELRMATRDEVFSNLRYSNKDNVLIILADAMDTMSLEKALELNPSLKEILQGFYLFQENLGAGGQTKLALPQILSGKTYTGKNYRRFVQDSLFEENALPARSVKHGRETFINALYWNLLGGISSPENANKIKKKNNISLSGKDKISLVFRFMPYAIKGKLENVVNYKTGADSSDDRNQQVFDLTTKRMGFRTNAPVTQFIYTIGVHPPYKDRAEVVEKWLKSFGSYVKALKLNGLYDKSTIIVIADHGDYIDHREFYPERKGTFRTFHFPAFLIKMPDSNAGLTVRKDLTSTVYLTDMLDRLYTQGRTVSVLNDYLSQLPATRPIFINNAEDGLENDTKYIASGNFSTLSLKKETQNNDGRKLKPLKENVLYTFAVENEKYPYPDWNGKNFGRYGGAGGADLFNKSELTLRADVKPETKKRFDFEIFVHAGNAAKLKITDQKSKKSTIVSGANKALYAIIEATANENGVFNFSFEKLSPFGGALTFVRYGSNEKDIFETGRKYQMSKSYRTISSLYSGWWTPEASGTWTFNKEAKARFKLASVPERDIRVVLSVTYLNYRNTNHFLKIMSPDGKVLYEKKLTETSKSEEKSFEDGRISAKSEEISFIYPANLIRKDSAIHLTIKSNVNQHNVLNPKESDTRTLGVFLTNVRFDEATE